MPNASERGFSLLETAVVIAVLGILAGGVIQIATLLAENASYQTTRERMQAVRQALVLHATREGYLPCPADATADEDEAGVAQPETNDGKQDCMEGRDIVSVPWRTLGIPSSMALDGWGNRFTYAVYDGSRGVTRGESADEIEGLNMRTCSCPGPNCTSPEEPAEDDDDYKLKDCSPGSDDSATKDYAIAFLRDKGLEVLTDADDEASAFMNPENGTGAAFVLISHGPNGGGAFSRQASQPFSVDGGTNEAENVPVNDKFVDARGSSAAGSEYDDIVVAVRIDTVAKEARWYLGD